MKTPVLTLVAAAVAFLNPSVACPPEDQVVEEIASLQKEPKSEDHKKEKTEGEKKNQKTEGLRILVAGGGYSPSGNQISLESNVKYFRRVLADLGLSDLQTHTLFADGKDEGRDLQYADPSFRIPEINRIMAELIGSTRGLQHQYRTNELEPDGPALVAELDKWFDEMAKQTSEGSLIYFTGHGGKGDKKTPDNTTIHLWNNQKMKVRDMVKRLDKLPKDKPVTFVMVQCYSGGFANVIFKDGDPKKGLSEHTRAGFFATVQDRVAAGCTPDIREENYKEYSTGFWEALCGKSRMGKAVKKPDYDGDGKTSYAEAHAHVILNSDTIDIPIKTSGAFLRKYSKLSKEKKTPSKEGKDANSTAESKCEATEEEWITLETDYKDILENASAADRAVLEGLSQRLNLKGPNRAKAAKDLSKKIEDERKKLADKKKKPGDETKRIKTKLAGQIRKRWPEVGNPYHPTARGLLVEKGTKEVMTIVNRDGEWAKYKKAKNEIAALDRKRFEWDRKKVKCMRFLRVLENVVLEANLSFLAKKDIKEAYERIVKLESGTLAAAK